MKETRNIKLEHIYTIWGLIVIIWALYRVKMNFPEWIDEMVAKPIVFLGPVLVYVLFAEKRNLSSIGWAAGKFARDLLIGVGFGLFFAIEGILANAVKYGSFSLVPKPALGNVGIIHAVAFGFLAALIEETLIRGFLFTRLKKEYKNLFKALIVSSVMYLTLLVPAIFALTRLSGTTLIIFLSTNIIMSFANTMIFNETKTITVPTLIHSFWNVAVVLYI